MLTIWGFKKLVIVEFSVYANLQVNTEKTYETTNVLIKLQIINIQYIITCKVLPPFPGIPTDPFGDLHFYQIAGLTVSVSPPEALTRASL